MAEQKALQLEDEVQQKILIDSAKLDCFLLRNNSGALNDANGRPVRYGLGNNSAKQNEGFKSSDLVGPLTITITPEMVGKKIAVFASVEVKKEGWKFTGLQREIAQQNYIDWVNNKGGIAFFANSVESFRTELAKFILKLKS